MRYVKWGGLALVALIVFGFLHYTLPRHDIVRIVDTDTRRIDFGNNAIFWQAAESGTARDQVTRDVKFIETVRENGKPLVFRNEDTGWGWPFYFKFDSYDLQTQAANLRSTEAAPQWVQVTRYGWRNQYFTIFPNAMSLKPVAGPEVRIIPWFNIIFLTLVVLGLLTLRRLWLNFTRRRIEPALEGLGEGWEGLEHRGADAARGARTATGRMKARLKGWFGG
ncbi:DUF1523 family protein [Frigidibacter sp. MR17.14]|uniref:DUF1523 family protein n=1 Tax=Frigidibacter sp. MR17.14 TaxID=3126509 RepID=UPI003012FAF7